MNLFKKIEEVRLAVLASKTVVISLAEKIGAVTAKVDELLVLAKQTHTLLRLYGYQSTPRSLTPRYKVDCDKVLWNDGPDGAQVLQDILAFNAIYTPKPTGPDRYRGLGPDTVGMFTPPTMPAAPSMQRWGDRLLESGPPQQEEPKPREQYINKDKRRSQRPAHVNFFSEAHPKYYEIFELDGRLRSMVHQSQFKKRYERLP